MRSRRQKTPPKYRRGRGPARFKRAECRRAIKAAVDAGLTVSRVDIDPATGKISVIAGKPEAGTADTPERILEQL
jgi:hypothetical protein